ncbi:MAG: TetR/AcrR family transcriptional regulator [Myxococcota bacterium]
MVKPDTFHASQPSQPSPETASEADSRPFTPETTALPGPGKRGPYGKSKRTRERILAAAFEVAGEFGLHRATVATIADRAGVAVGNLHYHFGSRDNLLDELMEWVQQEALSIMQVAIADAPHAYALHEATIRAHLAFVRRNPAYIRLAEEVRLHRPELYKRHIANWLRMIRENLEAGIRSNEIRSMEPDEIANTAYFMLGTRYFIDQMIECVDGRPYPGDEAIVSAYLDFVQIGLTKRENS